MAAMALHSVILAFWKDNISPMSICSGIVWSLSNNGQCELTETAGQNETFYYINICSEVTVTVTLICQYLSLKFI